MSQNASARTFFTDPQFLFNETLRLLENARDYMIWSRHMRLSAAVAADYGLESSRLTARLTAVMAWVLARRAVAKGELDFDRANQEFRLANRDTCEVDRAEDLGPELEELADLMRASLSLYRRVAALDAAIDQPITPGLALVSA